MEKKKSIKEVKNEFWAACERGDLNALERMFEEEVVDIYAILQGLSKAIENEHTELIRKIVSYKRDNKYILLPVHLVRKLDEVVKSGNLQVMRAVLSQPKAKEKVTSHDVALVLRRLKEGDNLDKATLCIEELLDYENVDVTLNLFNAASQCSMRYDFDKIMTKVAKLFAEAPNEFDSCRNDHFANDDTDYGFAAAIEALESTEDGETPRTLIELQHMAFMGAIRDKPNWRTKILDESIVMKWREECPDVESKRFDLAIAELRWLVDYSSNSSAQPAAADGVYCFDYFCDDDLESRLLAGVQILRSRPAIGSNDIDRHPGTPQMVDLVHPSLYCYEYGVSPLIGSASTTEAPPWDTFIGLDKPVEAKPKHKKGLASEEGLQWLPAEFYATENECKIRSYINNLHPKQYPQLYKDLAKLFFASIPAFEAVLSEVGAGPQPRQFPIRVECSPYEWYEEPSDEEDEDDDDWEDNRVFIPPTLPDKFVPLKHYALSRKQVNLYNRPLQVIVKIATLEIDTFYDGGSWHIEGMRDERIVATSCYYLQNENIQGGNLDFRTAVCEPEYEQNDDRGVEMAYGLVNEGALVQPRGCCSTFQNRLLAWPNTLQHRVGRVDLLDETKTGKRTVICFFLVDPSLRIRSTANVPPQSRHWLALEVSAILIKLIPSYDLRQRISEFVHGTTYEAAVLRRDRLMDERKITYQGGGRYDDKFFERTFSLCEH